MDMNTIEIRVMEIEANAGDDTEQHILEDDLFYDFVTYISTLNNPIAIKAKMVLKVKEVDFSRCYG